MRGAPKHLEVVMNRGRHEQIKTEAAATCGVLLAIILFWIAAGFGASYLPITIWHMPLWVITGCVGTWLFAILMTRWLIASVFADMDLEDGEKDA